MFGKENRKSKQQTKTKGNDIVLNIEIDFMEAVEGCTKTLQFNRTDLCVTCKGTKAKPGTTATQCGACGGQGYSTIK